MATTTTQQHIDWSISDIRKTLKIFGAGTSAQDIEKQDLVKKILDLNERHCGFDSKSFEKVKNTMLHFARDTGLDPPASNPRRYLWTDAFAVCQYLDLYEKSKDETFKNLAIKLVNQVHNTLGKHRNDDPRKGQWLSSLNEAEGSLHPTLGGLRIGKKLPERAQHESVDDDLEWDRDGQYFHYITKWMHALLQIGKHTGETMYFNQAAELIIGIHNKFTHRQHGTFRMYWKMSCDLTRWQVPSMGHHDPLDGFLTYSDVYQHITDKSLKEQLINPIQDLETICKGKDWYTNDPLGLGGIMSDSLRVYGLYKNQNDEKFLRLLGTLLADSHKGITNYSNKNHLNYPVKYRLAFREFGVSIGTEALRSLTFKILLNETDQKKYKEVLNQTLQILEKALPLRNNINTFWDQENNRNADSWKDHGDINNVMWCCTMMPDGFLE